jgi:hypothetical protein
MVGQRHTDNIRGVGELDERTMPTDLAAVDLLEFHVFTFGTRSQSMRDLLTVMHTAWPFIRSTAGHGQLRLPCSDQDPYCEDTPHFHQHAGRRQPDLTNSERSGGAHNLLEVLEWTVTASLLALAIAYAVLTHVEWCRAYAAPSG